MLFLFLLSSLLTSGAVCCREDLLRRALGTTWDVLSSTEQPISAQIDQKVALVLMPGIGIGGLWICHINANLCDCVLLLSQLARRLHG